MNFCLPLQNIINYLSSIISVYNLLIIHDILEEIMGWITSIIIGTLVGWLAGKIMKSSHGLLINFLLGWGGSILGKFLADLLKISSDSLVGDIAFSLAGACLILFIYNKFIKK